MERRFDIEELMKEVDRYLTAVALFRALECEPGWKAELDAKRCHADVGRAERPLRADVRLH